MDEWVYAHGTTLGADNGLGVAVLWLSLRQDLVHGPVEALITVDEETGMTGARGLKPAFLKEMFLSILIQRMKVNLYVGCCRRTGRNCCFQIQKPRQPQPDTKDSNSA